MIEEISAMQSRIAGEKYDRELRLALITAGLVDQPTLADQLRCLAARLTGLNSFDRARLADITAAVRRKEADFEKLARDQSLA